MAPTVSDSRLCYQLISFIFPFGKYSSVTSSDMLGIQTNLCDSLYVSLVLPFSLLRYRIRAFGPLYVF